MLEEFYKKDFKSAESFGKYWKFYWFSTVSGDFLKGKQKEDLKVEEIKTSNNFTLRVGNHIDLGTWGPVATFFMYMNLGVNILDKFYYKHKQQEAPYTKELSFGVKKAEPLDINGHLVRGVFDRIDSKNNLWYLTDYKTNKKSPEEDSFELHRSPQFTLYSYAFRKLFNTKEKYILFYHLRSGDVFKTYRNEKDFDYLKKLLDEVAEGISKDNFVPFYDFHCNFCDYKMPCEKYNVSYRGGPSIDLEGKIMNTEKFTEWDVPDWIEMQAEER